MANILVVEDNLILLRAMTLSLQKKGYTVTGLSDSLKLEEHLVSEYDLLITDVFMPGKEGLEIIAQTKEAYPDMKIIVISGTMAFGDVLSVAVSLGADAKLAKAFFCRRASGQSQLLYIKPVY